MTTLLPPGVKVHLALGYVDMRKGIDGLAMLVQGVLRQDPFTGHLFAFRGAPAKLNDVEPFAYLKDVLERLSNGPPPLRLDPRVRNGRLLLAKTCRYPGTLASADGRFGRIALLEEDLLRPDGSRAALVRRSTARDAFRSAPFPRYHRTSSAGDLWCDSASCIRDSFEFPLVRQWSRKC
jgi:hypothetical protein